MLHLIPGYSLLASHFADLPIPNTSCAGKTIIVTGATSGLGLEAARHLARLGDSTTRIILGVRSSERGARARDDILSSLATAEKPDIQVWPLDLGSFASVTSFGDRAGAELSDSGVHILLENAGVAMDPRKSARREGYEETITCNVLSTFLLALLLLPLLRKAGEKGDEPARLTFVSSGAHAFTSFPQRKRPEGEMFEALRGADMWWDRYNVSKFLDVVLARELASQLSAASARAGRDTPVVVNTLNPGYCTTDIARHASFPISTVLALLEWLGVPRSAEMGSRTLLAAALGGRETHGRYMDSCEAADESSLVRSEEGWEVGRRAWREVVDILEGVAPGVGENVG